jgi:hypothetical protein
MFVRVWVLIGVAETSRQLRRSVRPSHVRLDAHVLTSPSRAVPIRSFFLLAKQYGEIYQLDIVGMSCLFGRIACL